MSYNLKTKKSMATRRRSSRRSGDSLLGGMPSTSNLMGVGKKALLAVAGVAAGSALHKLIVGTPTMSGLGELVGLGAVDRAKIAPYLTAGVGVVVAASAKSEALKLVGTGVAINGGVRIAEALTGKSLMGLEDEVSGIGSADLPALPVSPSNVYGVDDPDEGGTPAPIDGADDSPTYE